MNCSHFDAGECRSCTLMGVPYASQVIDLASEVGDVLRRHVADQLWSPPFVGEEAGFRNKAKLVVGGT